MATVAEEAMKRQRGASRVALGAMRPVDGGEAGGHQGSSGIKRGRRPAARGGVPLVAAETRKSQFQYLKNINVHDRWLRMAVVHQALSQSCSISPEDAVGYTAELRRFESFGLFTLVFALSYLKRVAGPQRLSFDGFTSLFLVCNVIALKYQDDYSTYNSRYLKMCNLSLRELNALEAEVLARLGYCVHIEYTEIIPIIDERISYLSLFNRRTI